MHLCQCAFLGSEPKTLNVSLAKAINFNKNLIETTVFCHRNIQVHGLNSQFEYDFCVSCASCIATLLTIDQKPWVDRTIYIYIYIQYLTEVSTPLTF